MKVQTASADPQCVSVGDCSDCPNKILLVSERVVENLDIATKSDCESESGKTARNGDWFRSDGFEAGLRTTRVLEVLDRGEPLKFDIKDDSTDTFVVLIKIER